MTSSVGLSFALALAAATFVFDAAAQDAVLPGAPAGTPEKETAPPTPVAPGADAKRKDDEQDPDLKSWFIGAGLGTRFNLSGNRVTELGLAELANGDLIAQVKRSDDAEIRILFETHYLFSDISIVGSKDDGKGGTEHGWLDSISAFAGCGFWSFVPGGGDSEGRRGCGPFVAVAFDKDASPEEFAIGHMVSFGDKSKNGKPFNLGYGIIFDPDAETLDTTLLVPGTFIVKPEYAESVKSGALAMTTREETLGAVLLFSTNF